MTDVVKRFLKYVSFDTRSNENSEKVPSSEKQRKLGEYLANELAELGLENPHIDEKGYVYAFLPATKGVNAENIGFIAHIDTSPDASGKGVKPQIIAYYGGDITLSETVSIKEKEFENLKKYIGQDLILTDGTTLLGADDKAGIAEIITACEFLIKNPEIPHGRISLCFTPDEEIGRGADYFDVQKFGAKWAYTVDGGELGEIEYENFNAANARVTVNGVNIHPGSAKNKMKNAILLANEFMNLLPPAETPAHTEGYEGFFHVCDFVGNETKTEVTLIIRDHDRDKFEAKKEFLKDCIHFLNLKHGEKTFSLLIKDSYYNMKEKILPHMHIINDAENAMKRVGVIPKIVAIRGGTDGARLSFMGLPCPNLSTGGENFHSVHEFISVQSMEKMVEVIVELMKR
ncbi:MAG: peptidase T [Clostridia bacterium]|nr:peptidase T [Clostridia bacterium]